jgi:hypothetical protein
MRDGSAQFLVPLFGTPLDKDLTGGQDFTPQQAEAIRTRCEELRNRNGGGGNDLGEGLGGFHFHDGPYYKYGLWEYKHSEYFYFDGGFDWSIPANGVGWKFYPPRVT